ncbi:hypothetical protein [Hellea balneolensis]|uniref:hypothetical protein n=1 Tax=Hellea balneolensis TaxID=287478 RepID=UPI0004097804|nr:hypothetical protein [Hellea balneolensis]
MTETHTSENPAELQAEEARSAELVKGMTSVLTISLIAIVILFAVVLAIFI